MKNKIGTQISLIISDEIQAEVERIAKKRKRSKADIYRMMITLGIDCHQDLEKIGIIAAVDFAYYVKDAVKKKSKENSSGSQMSLI